MTSHAVASTSSAPPRRPRTVCQYRNVLAALRGEEDLLVGLEENRRSLAVICAVYESARTGRPVRL